MISGSNFLNYTLQGKPIPIDKKLKEEVMKEIAEKYPKGIVEIDNASVLVKMPGDYNCMVCGGKLTRVTNMKWDKVSQSWTPRKSKDNIHQAVCMNCNPEQLVAIRVVYSVAKK